MDDRIGTRIDDGKPVRFYYYPDVFTDVVNLEHAKQLILTRDGDLTSEVRWEIETKFTVDTLLDSVLLDKNSVVLDYGCGVGRLSKALIERTDCAVVGVDMSEKMRELAVGYVDRPRFVTCSSDDLRRISNTPFDCAIAAWVLQHCLAPNMDIDLIAEHRGAIIVPPNRLATE